MLRSWQSADDPYLWKVILSPEFGERLDLRSVTQRWVQSVERDLDTKLQWVAVEHHNTDHPHVHLAIRGLDDRGKALTLDPTYIKQTSRTRAQEIATRDIGFRSLADIRLAHERQIVQQRFTDLDRTLVKAAGPQLVVDFEGPIPGSRNARAWRLAQIRRLAQLSRMGLAERTGKATWRLDAGLEKVLRLMQTSQDRQKVAAEHRQMISDPSALVVSTKLDHPGQRVSGCLVGTGLDEAANRSYMLIEGFDGQVHYVHQPAKMERLRGEGTARIGDFVAIEAFEPAPGKTRVRVEVYGRKITDRMLDREIQAGALRNDVGAGHDTVAGAFQAAAHDRQKQREMGR